MNTTDMPFKFETRDAAGKRCCGGDHPDFGRCATCKTATVIERDDEPVVDAYTSALATLRAAAAKPESTFAEQYKADRLRALEAEAVEEAEAAEDRLAADFLSPVALFDEPPTAEELAEFRPPNGYQIALTALRAKETR